MRKNRKLMPDLSGYVPPGMDWEYKVDRFCTWMSCAALFALCAFMLQYIDTLNDLYVYKGVNGRARIPGAVMADFYTLMDWVFVGYQLIAVSMLFSARRNYAYHHQGSKSIYLMRRLPDRWERHRRCLGLPVMGIACCVLAVFVTVVLCYAWYILGTPSECLTPHQWEKFWRLL